MSEDVVNKFEVPKRAWKRWSNQARAVFNDTYSVMMDNPQLFLHPQAKRAPAEHWRTTSWNAAWIAAEAAREAARLHA